MFFYLRFFVYVFLDFFVYNVVLFNFIVLYYFLFPSLFSFFSSRGEREGAESEHSKNPGTRTKRPREAKRKQRKRRRALKKEKRSERREERKRKAVLSSPLSPRLSSPLSPLLSSPLLSSPLLSSPSSLLFSSLWKGECLHFLICITPYCSDIAFNRSVCGCSCRLPLEDPWSMVWLLTPDLGIFIISLITLILCSRLLKKREEGPIPHMSTLLQEVSWA